MAVPTEPGPSKKAIIKRLQSKISAEILAITGFEKLPDNLKKAIKKASKKIIIAIEHEQGEPGLKQDEGTENKKDASPKATKKTDPAKSTVKPSNTPNLKNQNKIPGVKKTIKAQLKSAPKKTVKKAPPAKSKPV